MDGTDCTDCTIVVDDYALDDLIFDAWRDLAARVRFIRKGDKKHPKVRALPPDDAKLAAHVYYLAARYTSSAESAVIGADNADLATISVAATGKRFTPDQIAHVIVNLTSALQSDDTGLARRDGTAYAVRFHCGERDTHWFWFDVFRRDTSGDVPLVTNDRPEKSDKYNVIVQSGPGVVARLLKASPDAVIQPLVTAAGGRTPAPDSDEVVQPTSSIVHLRAERIYVVHELPSGINPDAAFVRMEQGIGYIARMYEQLLASRFEERQEPYPITYLFDDAFEDKEQYDLIFIPALFDWNLRVATLIEKYSRPDAPIIRRLLPIPTERADNDIEFIKFAISYHLLFGTVLHTIFVPPGSHFLQTEFGTDASSFTAGGLFIQMDEMYERDGQVTPRPKTDPKKVSEFFERMERLGDHAHLLRYNERTFTHSPDPNLLKMWSPFLRDLQNGACAVAVCGKPLDPGALDHIVPLPAGNNSLINLRLVCGRRSHEHAITDLPHVDLTRILQRRLYASTVLQPTHELLKKLTDRTLVGVAIGSRWPSAVRLSTKA